MSFFVTSDGKQIKFVQPNGKDEVKEQDMSKEEIVAHSIIAQNLGADLLALVKSHPIEDAEHRSACMGMIGTFIKQVKNELKPQVRNYLRTKGPGREAFKMRVSRGCTMIYVCESMIGHLRDWKEGNELPELTNEGMQDVSHRIIKELSQEGPK